jgi:receptor protein-tyrosine kinase
MKIQPTPRAHLVERAMAAMGGAQVAHRSPAEHVVSQLAERTLEAVGTTLILDRAPAAELPEPRFPRGRPPIPLAKLLATGLIARAGAAPRTRITEELALIQAQLLHDIDHPGMAADRTACRQILLVTSARPGEGKSFIALNLAAGMATSGAAELGRPVVLVDIHGSADALSGRMGVAGERGICTLAAQPALRGESLLLRTAIDGLWFLPYGAAFGGHPGVHHNPHPTGPAITAAIRALSAMLPDHLLVLDTPPALSTSDAHALAAIAGQTVIVVRAERTRREEVEATLDVVEACPTLRLLLNRTRFTASDSFGSESQYGTRSHA